MFTLAVEDTFDFPLSVRINSGRTQRTFAMHLTADRLSVAEWDASISGVDELDDESQEKIDAARAFLLRHITGWRGQQLVLDGDGKPAEFSPEALDAMLGLAGMPLLVYRAYAEATVPARGDEARRKNSRA